MASGWILRAPGHPEEQPSLKPRAPHRSAPSPSHPYNLLRFPATGSGRGVAQWGDRRSQSSQMKGMKTSFYQGQNSRACGGSCFLGQEHAMTRFIYVVPICLSGCADMKRIYTGSYLHTPFLCASLSPITGWTGTDHLGSVRDWQEKTRSDHVSGPDLRPSPR